MATTATEICNIALMRVRADEIGDIDGVLGEKTVVALNKIGLKYKIFGFKFKLIYPILEKLIAEKQHLG